MFESDLVNIIKTCAMHFDQKEANKISRSYLKFQGHSGHFQIFTVM